MDFVSELVDGVFEIGFFLFAGDVEHIDFVSGFVHASDFLDELLLFALIELFVLDMNIILSGLFFETEADLLSLLELIFRFMIWMQNRVQMKRVRVNPFIEAIDLLFQRFDQV